MARIRRCRPARLTPTSRNQHPAAVLVHVQVHDDRASSAHGHAALAREGHRHEQQAPLEEDVAEDQTAHVRDACNLEAQRHTSAVQYRRAKTNQAARHLQQLRVKQQYGQRHGVKPGQADSRQRRGQPVGEVLRLS